MINYINTPHRSSHSRWGEKINTTITITQQYDL